MSDLTSAASAAPAPSAECIICGQSAARGIRIAGQFICEDCEREIVRTDVTDARYHLFIERMRCIWWNMV
ncbi:MAG: sigma factor G inhibitor Gin [Thermoflavifilum sp.]|nr:sigma factor G inhibitor Gin [Thermoflavifilum sp.]MCL6515129.1 sigma factor G inhibitor Gin [Alicyclobacillus sp.]